MPAAGNAFKRDLAAMIRTAVTIDLETEAPAAPIKKRQVYEDRGNQDISNARRFAEQHRDSLRYAVGPGWYLWDGKRWSRQGGRDIPRVMRLAKQTANAILAVTDHKARKSVRRLTCQRPRLEAMVNLAKDELLIDAKALDANPYLLNCRNCTVDLRNGKTKPHDPEDLITKLVPVDFNPRAKAPRWRQFMREIFPKDTDTQKHLQRAIGYCTTADVREEVFWILVGDGNNGKGVFTQTVLKVLDDYGMTARQEMIIASRDSKREDVASLFGTHCVVINETSQDAVLDEAFMKNATGGDNLRGRFLYQEQFEYPPTQHYIVCTNHRPRIRGQDKGTWRRPLLVEFKVIFGSKDPKENPQRKKINKGLKTYLARNELSGILNWIVEGAVKYWNRGKPNLRVSKAVLDATELYRRDENIMERFIEEKFIRDPKSFISIDDFTRRFSYWLTEELKRKPWEKMTITTRLKRLGYEHGKKGKAEICGYYGLRWDENKAIENVREKSLVERMGY